MTVIIGQRTPVNASWLGLSTAVCKAVSLERCGKLVVVNHRDQPGSYRTMEDMSDSRVSGGALSLLFPRDRLPLEQIVCCYCYIWVT
jgi:hypothetical protein